MGHESLRYAIVAVLVLSACTANRDLQGLDPVDYYTAHPIENKVQSRLASQQVHFAAGSATLSDDAADALQRALHGISPPAVDSITIRMSPDDKFELQRENALERYLKKMGYGKIRVIPSTSVKRGIAWVDVAYLAVVPPDCPDWRMSPVTTYSNTWQANTGCAEAVNMGMMIADPHDLVRGTGDVPVNTEPSSKALGEYNAGKNFMSTTLSAGSSGSSSGGSSGSSGSSSSSSGTSGGGDSSSSGSASQ